MKNYGQKVHQDENLKSIHSKKSLKQSNPKPILLGCLEVCCAILFTSRSSGYRRGALKLWPQLRGDMVFSGHKDAGIMPHVPFRTGTEIFELSPNIRQTP
ncbi:hypothetical protein TNCT_49091 [Trichonephila clavata]|uniref:Uncharacterized protein n=1 Tax=Trichonephila clavata TaxID=2740835 RepID=A0A8X6G9P2_TRICU|nr:hypothetical protein TNCT_49091 [Trichonephila clavata]